MPRARPTPLLFLLATIVALAAVGAGCGGDGTGDQGAADDATADDATADDATADDATTDDATTDGDDVATGGEEGGGADGACASVEVDGREFTLESTDGDVSVTGVAPEGYEVAAVPDPCEVAVLELVAPVGDEGELATLGFTLDLGPLLRDSITELANEAIGLLVSEDDEVLVDDRVTVDDRPARRVEIALAGAADAPGGRGLLIFVEAGGDQVATLTVVGRVDDYEIADDDVASVLESLRITSG